MMRMRPAMCDRTRPGLTGVVLPSLMASAMEVRCDQSQTAERSA